MRVERGQTTQGKTLERFILASRSITNAVSLTIVITPCELFLLLLQFQPTIAVARSHMYIASLAHPQVIATEKSPSVRAAAASMLRAEPGVFLLYCRPCFPHLEGSWCPAGF